MSRVADILREHLWSDAAQACLCGWMPLDEGIRPGRATLKARLAHLAALLDAAPVADREALATIIEPALVEASNKFVPMSYKTLADAAAVALVDAGLLAGPVHKAEPDAALRKRIEQARADIEAEAQRREARSDDDSWLGLAWANDTLRAALKGGSE
jgi:hypothetical protein